MSSISSSSYYSVGSQNSGSQGIAGLMSGMDTEAMVEKMLSGTQGKIDKQEALKQQTLWKQDIYRDMITSINSFSSKYFDSRFGATSKNNFANNDFFNAMVSKVKSGNAVKLIGTGTSASMGDFKIAVKQLAAEAGMTSESPVSGDQTISGGVLSDDILTKQFSKKIAFQIGTDFVNVDLTAANSQEDVAKAVQDKLTEAGITDVTAKVYDGKFRLVSSDPDKTMSVVAAGSSPLGIYMAGLSTYNASKITDASGKVTGKMITGNGDMDLEAGYSLDLTLDGITKTIKITDVERTDTDGNYTTTADKFKEAIQKEVKKAFGESLTVSLDGNRLKFGINVKDAGGNVESGHELVITGLNADDTFGISAGSSSHISSGSTLKSLGLNGDSFAFNINGTEFKFNGEDSIAAVMSKINNSDAGVRITYSSLSDTFKMEATSAGSKYGIEIEQTEGDLLTKLFGSNISAGSTASTNNLLTGSITGTELDADYSTKSGSISLRVNGTEYTYTLPAQEKDKAYSKEEIEKSFNNWLTNKFKTKAGTTDPNIAYKDGKLEIADGFQVEFAAAKIDLDDPKAVAEAMKTDLAFAMGFNRTATSNIASADTNISDLNQLDGITLLNSGGGIATKLSDISKIEINGTQYDASYKDGRLSLSGSGSVTFSAADAKAKELFGGKDTLTLGDGKLQSGAVSQGKDAIVIVNGVETTRNSNSFTIDGISMELTQVSDLKKDSSGNPIAGSYEETVITSSRDTDAIFDAFKTFVEDYNKMVSKLNGYATEDTDYRKYAPLSAEQRKEMSEKEIELWEEKSKSGLVRNDSTVTDFLSQLRNILYTKPDSSNVALYQIGIETTQDYNDGGQIQLDETALRNAIAADPDSVRNLFTDASDGISKKLTSAMDNVAKQSLSNPGSLVQMAGVKGGSTEKANTLYDRINSIENRIKDLKYKYQKERTRYWNQFTSMEKIMSNFNSQSSMISQQFGG